MAKNPNQPRDYDAVLGNQNPLPGDSAVLGGLAGVKHRLASASVQQRIAALEEALKYDREGLDLVVRTLKADKSWQVKRTAYWLLQKSAELEVKLALHRYNPYQLLECLCTLTEHSDRVSCVAISPDGQTLVSGSYDKTIKVWDLRTGQLLHTLGGHSCFVSAVAISPDGQTLVSSSLNLILTGNGWRKHDYNDTIKVWNLQTGQEIRTLREKDPIVYVAISPDGQTLVSVSWGTTRKVNGDWDTTIKVWDMQTGQEIRTFGEPPSTIRGHIYEPGCYFGCFALIQDGQALIYSTCEHGCGTFCVRDLQTGQKICRLEELPRRAGNSHEICSMALSQDGQTLVSGGRRRYVLALALSPDGQTLMSGGNSHDKTIKIWNWHTGQEIHTLEGHPVGVTLALSADGQTLASGSYDIKVWGVGVG